jgi:Tol biopolymer transport system component
VKPIRGGLVSLLGIVFALSAAAPAWGAYPGANGVIAYTGMMSDDNQPGEIYTISPAGGAPTRLTDNRVAEFAPSWSADGRRIVYVHWGRPVGGIWVMRANGANQHAVFHTRSASSSPYFSPGGGRIAFAEGHSLATIRPDGTAFRRLLWGYVQGPKYSPSGKRIVFAGAPRGREGGSKIWTIGRDGSGLHRLTNGPRGDADRNPDWSPDGRRIVYSHCEEDEPLCFNGDAYSIRADGTGKHRVYPADGAPVYSPDGDRIALDFAQWDNVYQDVFCADLFTISIAGADRRPITHYCDGHPQTFTGVAVRPSWQPLPKG